MNTEPSMNLRQSTETPAGKSAMISTATRRLLLATLLWVIFWPALRFIQLGDITGPKAFFWITGMANYPVTALLFSILDGFVSRFTTNAWVIFFGSAVIAACTVPLYHQRIGFTLGVFIEAWLY